MINNNRSIYKQSHCGYIGLISGLILFCLQTSALASDNPETIRINADHMQLNVKTGNSEYTGNVRISQGKLLLLGDKVTVEQKNNEVEHITVIGKPARYNHVTNKGEAIEAESEQMVYNAGRNKLTMSGNAKLKQPDHKVSSQKIVYDTLNKIVIAGGTGGASKGGTSIPGSTDPAAGKGSQKQRVNITLTPKKQPQKSKDAATE